MKLEHQIGGHPNVTSDESGTLVIKPASPREIAFYQLSHSTPAPPKTSTIPPLNERLSKTEDPGTHDEPLIKRELLLGHLKQFLPRFYGTLKVQSPESIKDSSGADPQPECIILSNLSAPYTRPAIIDIKLGTTLYDVTDASLSAEKIAKMEAKMRVRSSVKTGAAITGFQTWDAEKGEFASLSREECGKLKPEELAGAFAKYVPYSHANAIKAQEPTTNAPSDIPSYSTSTHRQSLLRVLRALLQSLENLHALLSHLEIRFIGASLLIIYEGDPFQLKSAWDAVDAGTSRGDGLEDDELYRGDDSDESDDEVEEGVEEQTGKGKGFFSHVFGKFGADAEGAQGFGLLDGSPPASPRRRPSNHAHETIAAADDEDDSERIPDADAHERLPRPFTLRLIDFAHTRLADGEGPDGGVLLGVRTVMELVKGRIEELERGGEAGEAVEGEGKVDSGMKAQAEKKIEDAAVAGI